MEANSRPATLTLLPFIQGREVDRRRIGSFCASHGAGQTALMMVCTWLGGRLPRAEQLPDPNSIRHWAQNAVNKAGKEIAKCRIYA